MPVDYAAAGLSFPAYAVDLRDDPDACLILVTTKQGKEGKLSLQYDGFVGWSNAYKVPAMLGAKDYMSVINETYFNTYGSVPQWNTLVPQSILDRVNQGWNGTDWFKAYENKNAIPR